MRGARRKKREAQWTDSARLESEFQRVRIPMVRPASLMLLLALAAPSLSGCCGSCYPSKFCCPPRPVVAQAPPCNGCGARYGPSYTYQPAYPPGAPSAALYPPGPPPAAPQNPPPAVIKPNP